MQTIRAELRKVAFLLPSLEGGGAERVYLNIANHFVASGLEVDMVLADRRGPFLERLDDRVRVVALSSRWKPGSVLALARYLRQEPPEILLPAMDIMNVAALFARTLSRSAVPIVVTSHLHMSMQVTGRRRLKDRVVSWLARALYRKAEAVVAVSEGVAKDLSARTGIPGDVIEVIHNPVDLQAIRSAAEQAPDHPWAMPGQPEFLVSIGRLVPQKDYPTLLQAFARVNHRGDLRLIILGEGPERPVLEAMAEELGLGRWVSFPGFSENPFSILSQASALVLSSRWEGFGLVLVEALACGCPVITTDCRSGPREILDGGRFGTLVPVGDPDALARAIELRNSRGRDPSQLRKRAEAFRVEAVAEKYLQVLKRAASQARRD